MYSPYRRSFRPALRQIAASPAKALARPKSRTLTLPSGEGLDLRPDQRRFDHLAHHALHSDFGGANRTVNIATQSTSQATYNQTLDRAIGAMRVARGLKLGEENDFEVYSNDSLVAAFAQVADTIRVGAFVVSVIALLAAGIGIMNIMLVSVTERTREIGLRKAIGARRPDITRQFLLEAVVLSEIGGLAGILLGIVGGNGIALWLDVPLVFPWGWALTGLVVCSIIGIAFGSYPAWKAASLHPIEALRFE